MSKKSQYRGFWTANGGSTWCAEPIVDTNFRRLKKNLREICSGNVFLGNYGYILIYDDSGKVYGSSVK